MIFLEVILMVMEYPLGTLFSWIAFSYFMTGGSLLSTLIWTIVGPLSCLISLVAYLLIGSQLNDPKTKLDSKYKDWIEIVDPELKKWAGQRIPVRSAYEWYFRGRINFKRPTLEIFLNRHQLFRMVLNSDHIWEFLMEVLYKAVNHERDGDKGEVAPVYNLGNDYYYAFLSDPMFYSSGVAYDEKESLDVVQKRKCGIVAESLQLQDGDKILDFGCGWGSWLIYCAQNFNVKCTGLTISQCQYDYATARVKKLGLEDRVTILLIDYREMTPDKFNQFDKITCFEMSEHVGIRNYQKFMAQVQSLLKDDGLFYLQIAGLRRAWQYEDLIWGVFMGKYIFPGADASCPLYWDVNQLERGGFEVHNIKNQGVHYAHTIEAWYHELVKNREQVVNKYDEFAYRRHELFLAWSTMIARQGSSAVWCITSAKNSKLDANSSVDPKTTLNRTKKFLNREFYTTKF